MGRIWKYRKRLSILYLQLATWPALATWQLHVLVYTRVTGYDMNAGDEHSVPQIGIGELLGVELLKPF